MPSSSPLIPPDIRPVDTAHMLPEHATRKQKSGSGPIVGVVIIVLLLIFGGLYFWGAQLNREDRPLPLIPGDASTN